MLALAFAAAPASAVAATTPSVDLSSAGPLTHIWAGNDLSCQVAHTGDSANEFYPGSVSGPADCGTFLSTGGTLYGPDFHNHDGSAAINSFITAPTPYTPVSQSAPSGAGTSSDPYKVTTAVSAGTTGLKLTQVDTYVAGTESYTSTVTVSNATGAPISALLYHAGDCYLQNDDNSYGYVDPAAHAPACTQYPNNVSATGQSGLAEEFAPVTSGSHYIEDPAENTGTTTPTIWAAVGSQTDLPDTCDCTNSEDSAAGINWDIAVPAYGSVSYTLITTFSATGTLPLTVSETADTGSIAYSGTNPARTTDGYTITISNPNATAVTAPTALNEISAALPAGFTYTAGSSTGATTIDPTVDGQSLTWNGPFTVPAASGGTSGTLTLHFSVTVPTVNGDYYSSAAGSATGYTVDPTGPAAPVTVTGGSDAVDVGNGVDTSGTEATPLSDVPVATFTDPDRDSTSYSATIDWGDGSASSPGTISAISGSPGSYTVTGSHTFAEQGGYTITVSITDGDGSGNVTTITSTATVADQPLVPAAQAFSATEGQAFSGAIATFTDGNTAAAPGDFAATVNWGDGSSSTGTVTALAGTPGGFTVSGGHTYAEAGSYTVTVSVQESDNPSGAASSQATAGVADAALTATGAGTLNSSGPSISGPMASFTDADPAGAAGDFTATIAWGDGSSSAGTVSVAGTGFSVDASHTFSGSGTFTATITVRDTDGATSTATTTIIVPAPAAGTGSTTGTGSGTGSTGTGSGSTGSGGDGSSGSGTGGSAGSGSGSPGAFTTNVRLSIRAPGSVHSSSVFCSSRRHAACAGLKLTTALPGSGHATWQLTACAAPHHHHKASCVTLGRLTGSATQPGTVINVFKLKAGGATARLLRRVRRQHMKTIRVLVTFTDAQHHVSTATANVTLH